MDQLSLQRIMYVEDEPDLQEIVGLSLREIGGFDLLVCSSGKEAIERAPEFRPQLVLLDVMMPGMDGPETLQELRKLTECAETPSAFITAKINTAETERLMEFGAIDIIGKPFDPMTLHETVANIWGRACKQPAPDSGNADVQNKLVVFTQRFQERMKSSTERLRAFRVSLTGDSAAPSPDTLAELHALAHRLNGSGATFGFANVSASAASLEALLQDCRNDNEVPTKGVIERLDNLVTQIQSAIDEQRSTEPIRSEIRPVSSHPSR